MKGQAWLKCAVVVPLCLEAQPDHLRLAQEHLDAERFAEARTELQKAIASRRATAGVYYQLGYAQWRLGDSAAARTAFLKELEFQPPDPHSLYYLGRIAEVEGAADQAISWYEKSIQAGPVLDAYERAGALHLKAGDVGRAIAHLENGVARRPNEASAHYRLAQAYARAGRRADAEREFQATRRLGGDARDAGQRVMDCERNLREGRIDAALIVAGEAATWQDADALIALGLVLGKHKLHTQAVGAFTRAAELLPENFEAHYNLGMTLLHSGDTSAAILPLERAAKLRPDSYDASLVLGMTLVRAGADERALPHLRRAAQLQPENVKLLALLGMKYTGQRYYQEAIRVLRQAVAAAPSNPDVRLLLIEAQYLNQDTVQALEEAQRAREAFPQNARCHLALGTQLMNLGRFTDAEPHVRQAAALDPALAEAHASLGDVLLKMGRAEDALTEFQAALSRRYDLMEAHLGAGKAMVQLQFYAEARDAMRKAAIVDPTNAQPHLILSQALRALGDAAGAKAALDGFQRLNRVRQEQRDRAGERVWKDSQ